MVKNKVGNYNMIHEFLIEINKSKPRSGVSIWSVKQLRVRLLVAYLNGLPGA